jgi:uncharacterized membrane protein YfcA
VRETLQGARDEAKEGHGTRGRPVESGRGTTTLSTSRLVLFCLVVALAFVVEAAAGFGGTVVTVSLGSALADVDQVLVRFLPANLLLSAYLVVKHRRDVDGEVLVRRVLPSMGLGLLSGLALARLTSPLLLKSIFAAFVLLLSLYELAAFVRRRPSSEPLRPTVAHAALFFAGILHGLFACGGPLAVWVVGREVTEKSRFRATLSMLWLVSNVLVVAGYGASGTITRATLSGSALLLPPLALGLFVGEKIHARLSPTRFRVAIFALLFVASTVLLVRTLASA